MENNEVTVAISVSNDEAVKLDVDETTYFIETDSGDQITLDKEIIKRLIAMETLRA